MCESLSCSMTLPVCSADSLLSLIYSARGLGWGRPMAWKLKQMCRRVWPRKIFNALPSHLQGHFWFKLSSSPHGWPPKFDNQRKGVEIGGQERLERFRSLKRLQKTNETPHLQSGSQWLPPSGVGPGSWDQLKSKPLCMNRNPRGSLRFPDSCRKPRVFAVQSCTDLPSKH